jgi:phosphate transport system substrate-binding protein
VIIDGIAGTDTSLGWVGFSFYEQNQDVVKAIEVDGGEGCVAPTFETISGGTYPLSRSLYIYVNNAKAAESEAVTTFVDFYMTDTGLRTAVEEVAYVTLPDDRVEATRSAWEGAGPA